MKLKGNSMKKARRILTGEEYVNRVAGAGPSSEFAVDMICTAGVDNIYEEFETLARKFEVERVGVAAELPVKWRRNDRPCN